MSNAEIERIMLQLKQLGREQTKVLAKEWLEENSINFARIIEDQAAEIERLRYEIAKQQWQPIETAPKDGSEILLRSRKGRHADGCYMIDKNGHGFWVWTLIKQEPMYWMPLPEPPP